MWSGALGATSARSAAQSLKPCEKWRSYDKSLIVNGCLERTLWQLGLITWEGEGGEPLRLCKTPAPGLDS